MREWTQSVANLFFLSERCTNAFYVGPTDVIPPIDSERYVTVEIVGVIIVIVVISVVLVLAVVVIIVLTSVAIDNKIRDRFK